MADENKVLLEIEIDDSQLQKLSTSSRKELERLTAERRELNKQIRKNGEATEAEAKELNRLDRAIKSTRRDLNLYNKELGATTGSLDKQRAQLARLNRQYDKFQVGIDGSEKELKQLERTIARQTKSIKAQEFATQRFQRNVGNYTGDIKRAFAGVGDIITGGIITGGLLQAINLTREFAAESTELFDVQAKQDAQLRSALVSTRGIAGKTFEDLKDQAQDLQGITLFGDEQINQAQSLLLTFTNVRGEIFDRTIPAVLDLSQRLGKDLKESSLQVGKALNDPVKGVSALAESGVQFSEQQVTLIKRLVETGDVAAAQGVILDELGTQFAGSAEAAALAGRGPLQQYQNKLNDIKEEIGEELLPVQTEFYKNLLNIITVAKESEGLSNSGKFNILNPSSIGNLSLQYVQLANSINKLTKEYLGFSLVAAPEASENPLPRVVPGAGVDPFGLNDFLASRGASTSGAGISDVIKKEVNESKKSLAELRKANRVSFTKTIQLYIDESQTAQQIITDLTTGLAIEQQTQLNELTRQGVTIDDEATLRKVQNVADLKNAQIVAINEVAAKQAEQEKLREAAFSTLNSVADQFLQNDLARAKEKENNDKQIARKERTLGLKKFAIDYVLAIAKAIATAAPPLNLGAIALQTALLSGPQAILRAIKFADGGFTYQGKKGENIGSHAAGGWRTKPTLGLIGEEGPEFVASNKTVNHPYFAPMIAEMDAFQKYSRGKRFRGWNAFADGGFTARSAETRATTRLNQERQTNLPPIVVAVEDIRRGITNVEVVESLGNA